VIDDRLGRDPYAGEYRFQHPGARIRLTENSRIKEGERLRVSWYHPIITDGSQVMCCLTEPRLYEVLRDQVRRVQELFQPKTFFMAHDEIRVADWCGCCRASGKTPGELLADNVQHCREIIREVNPQAQVVVWSDMFDPFHNAVDHYYLVNGSLKGSWKGLEKDIIIGNWNSGKAHESLQWFAECGHRQILAGYYDAEGINNLKDWLAAAKGIPRESGFMYTTWQNQYTHLERYGKALREAR
jgi:hypothetical protein